MFKRTITSIILILITGWTIFFMPILGFVSVSSIFIGLGLYEFFKIVGQRNSIDKFKTICIILGMLIPFLTYWTDFQEFKFFIMIFFLLFIIQFTRRQNQDAALIIALSIFGIFYIGGLFNFLLKIRLLENGTRLVAFLLLVTKAGDMGAYIIGHNFGKHRLIPRISPNKSIEGAIGGFVFSIIAASLSRLYLTFIPFAHIIISGIIIGIFAQLGDLAESVIKRDYSVKDSGPFVPGLGGVLDLIDSILFTAPLFYYYLTWLLLSNLVRIVSLES